MRQQAEPFSVRQWVRQGAARSAGGQGVLFLSYKVGEIAALRSAISAWMRMPISESMRNARAQARRESDFILMVSSVKSLRSLPSAHGQSFFSLPNSRGLGQAQF